MANACQTCEKHMALMCRLPKSTVVAKCFPVVCVCVLCCTATLLTTCIAALSEALVSQGILVMFILLK